MRAIIIGCGRVGASTAAELDQQGDHVTVIDLDQRAFNRLPQSFAGVTVRGNGTAEDILRGAGAEMADLVMALTEGDNRNALAAQMAKHTFGVPRRHRQDQRPAARGGVPVARPRDDLPHRDSLRRPGHRRARRPGGDRRPGRGAHRPADAELGAASVAVATTTITSIHPPRATPTWRQPTSWRQPSRRTPDVRRRGRGWERRLPPHQGATGRGSRGR